MNIFANSCEKVIKCLKTHEQQLEEQWKIMMKWTTKWKKAKQVKCSGFSWLEFDRKPIASFLLLKRLYQKTTGKAD